MNDFRNQPACRDVQLDVLLFGDEQSAEYQNFASHVELCRHCQARLAELAAEEGDWANVRTMLRRNQQETMPKTTGARRDSDCEPPASPRPMKLDFLAPPSHPEMLGRLGRYEIEQLIGAGGMGIVLKGFDTELNRPVAIKVLAPHLAHSGPARQRFAREARSAASIVNEHVVAIHDVKSEHVAPYLVMQYIAGRSLQQRVDQEGPLAAVEILRIGLQAAAGLAAAHDQGVIHRDVKPANILLENGVERAMLTDFGLARAADDATLTHSGIIAGTPDYMSPEQARGQPVDARSDLFSLGAVLYFMSTGHPPFRAEQAMATLHRICHDRHRNVQDINPTVPDELADVIDRLLEKKPSRRFAAADEVQQSLLRALAAIQQPSRWHVRRWLRRLNRRRWQLLAAVGVLLTVVGVGWLAGWLSPKADAGRAGKSLATNEPAVANEDLAARFRADQADMARIANELTTIGRSLQQIESSTSEEPLSGLSLGESWQSGLKAAAAEAARLEERWTRESNEALPLHSVIGEKP
jgi:eukaryotic-like serine/threonine-protein kinase